MVKELWENLKKILAPYTFEDYIRDQDPKSLHDVEKLERRYNQLKADFQGKY
jgi:hypothetical protein